LAIKKIVVKFVDELQTSLTAKGIKLTLSEAVIDRLAEQGYDPKMGARPLARKIDELIRVPLSKRILFDRLSDCVLHADLNGDTVTFTMEEPRPTPIVDADGYIVLDTPKPEL
jgi:ATP-dependent Clp protease ATP-binding subunit ClpA